MYSISSRIEHYPPLRRCGVRGSTPAPARQADTHYKEHMEPADIIRALGGL